MRQRKTTERFRTEKIKKKQHKAKYLTGKVPQPKKTESLPTEKMEKKQDNDKYLTGKVPFMDPMMDNLYSENVMRNFSVEGAPS